LTAQPGIASYYDRYWSAEVEPRYDPDPALAALIFDSVSADTRVLDVGCGAGRSYAPELARRANSYVGVDISERAVEAALAAGLDARVIEDASTLPFHGESFDLAVCVEVLEHLFAPQLAVAEMYRVLRPGGRAVVSAPNMAYWRMRWNAVIGLWNPAGDALSVEEPWRDPHIRFFTLSAMERMLRRCGFSHVEVGAHGGRGLDHLTSRPTSFGQGRAYRALERIRPSLLGMTIHAVAVK
jgi:methionine biosynthesis protein MetW